MRWWDNVPAQIGFVVRVITLAGALRVGVLRTAG